METPPSYPLSLVLRERVRVRGDGAADLANVE
jgi:hypothetical protein